VDREHVPGAGLDADRESHGGAFTHASGAAGRGPCVVGQGPLSSAIIRCVALRGHKGAYTLLRMNRLELFDHTGCQGCAGLVLDLPSAGLSSHTGCNTEASELCLKP
jgi:hypothetical protein